jgi:hypothetical protein
MCVLVRLTQLVILLSSLIVGESQVIDGHPRVSAQLQGDTYSDEISHYHNKYSEFLSHIRRLQSPSSGSTLADFFNFSIAVTPSEGHDTSLCTLADQNLLTNEVDLLLLNFGTANVLDINAEMFSASVCTQSLVNSSDPLGTRNRRAVARRTWIWTGAGGCKNCRIDNADQRPPPPSDSEPSIAPTSPTPTPAPMTPTRLPTTSKPTRFPTTSKPTRFPRTSKPTRLPTTSKPTRMPTSSKPSSLTPTTIFPGTTNTTSRALQNDIFLSIVRSELWSVMFYNVVPNYYQCLGSFPEIDVEASRIGVSALSNSCPDSGLPFLGVSNLDKDKMFAFQSAVCGTCVSLDFSSTNATEPISGGTYVKDQWKNSLGVTVTASSQSGGYTPNGHARIYDTSQPVFMNEGNADLGSPNVNCGGLGVGADGQPGEPGENCVPINSKYSVRC